MKNDKLTEKIIGLCFEIHNALGPGYKEKIYKNALILLLKKTFLKYECEKSFKIKFKNCYIGTLRADLIIENQIIVEIKAITGFLPKTFESQLIAYLKSSNLKTGLLINFGNSSCKVRRLINSDYSDKNSNYNNSITQSNQVENSGNHRNHGFHHCNHK